MKTESNDVENLLASTEAQPQPQLAESVDIKSLSVELFQFVGGGSGVISRTRGTPEKFSPVPRVDCFRISSTPQVSASGRPRR
jgi:hypothetical protein